MSLAAVIRAALVLALSAHVFFMYSFARAEAETIGFDLLATAGAVLFALVMMLPFVWALGIADLPDLYQRYIRPAQRWKRGECPACGYDVRAHRSEVGSAPRLAQPHAADPKPARCPECGCGLVPPPRYQYGSRTVRRFLTLIALALLLGCGAGEATLLYDEYLFQSQARVWRESHREGARSFRRQRAWPNSGAWLRYEDGRAQATFE